MHKPIMLRALHEAQTPKRYAHLTPALRRAFLSALSEFETILSVRMEKKLITRSTMDDLGGVLSVLFAVETVGEPKDSQWMVDVIQRQVTRAKESLTTALKPPTKTKAQSKDPGNMSGW